MLPTTLNVALLGFVVLPVWTGNVRAMNHGTPEQQAPASADPFESRRVAMVTDQIVSRGVADERVLEALRRVPRHRFVPRELQRQAYADRPLAIGEKQTISQPYIVALMTELIRPEADTKILEIGTGSGYQAAVLAECAAEVYTIEILPELGRRAAELLKTLGYERIRTRIGDGYDGWPDAAPFDAIVVTAAPPSVPQPLLDQLALGGRLVIPVGQDYQNLVLITRTADGFERKNVTPVRFVPMTGKAQSQP